MWHEPYEYFTEFEWYCTIDFCFNRIMENHLYNDVLEYSKRKEVPHVEKNIVATEICF